MCFFFLFLFFSFSQQFILNRSARTGGGVGVRPFLLGSFVCLVRFFRRRSSVWRRANEAAAEKKSRAANLRTGGDVADGAQQIQHHCVFFLLLLTSLLLLCTSEKKKTNKKKISAVVLHQKQLWKMKQHSSRFTQTQKKEPVQCFTFIRNPAHFFPSSSKHHHHRRILKQKLPQIYSSLVLVLLCRMYSDMACRNL